MPFLDRLSPAAAEIRAVNTIHHLDGKLIGHNTDYFGFQESLKEMLGNHVIEKALILGTGGSSKAVAYALKMMHIEFTYISRNKKFLTYEELTEEIIKDHHLIINTTPLGMYPKIDAAPLINFTHLTDQHYCYDLIYNPEKTLFLIEAQNHGATIKNGYDMLLLQAEKSWQIWNQ